MANLSQVQRAWMLYALDNGGRVVGSYVHDDTPDWAAGQIIDIKEPAASDWEPTPFPRKSPLWQYCGEDSTLFRCPAAPANLHPSSTDSREPLHTLNRTISLNCWVGGVPGSWLNPRSEYRIVNTLDDFSKLSPAETFTFIDEREDSLNDGYFAIRMDGDTGKAEWRGDQAVMVDFPAYWHDRAASMAFADGHVGFRRWADNRTVPPPGTNYIALNVSQPWNPDVRWLQLHSTRRVVP